METTRRIRSDLRCSWQRGEDNTWAVKVDAFRAPPGAKATGLIGMTALVTTRAGKTSEVVLGAQISSWNDGRAVVYAVGAGSRNSDGHRIPATQSGIVARNHERRAIARQCADSNPTEMAEVECGVDVRDLSDRQIVILRHALAQEIAMRGARTTDYEGHLAEVEEAIAS